MIVALTKHSRCQRGVVDREDLRSVQIESIFGGKQFDYSKFRRLTEAGEGGRLRVERRADPSNKVLLKERGDLFKQVGLPEVAGLDYAAAQRHQPEPHLNDQFSFDETPRFIVAWPDFCLACPSA